MKWRFLYGCKKESVVEQEASAVAKEWQYYRNRTEKKAEKRKKERPLFSFCNELASTRLLPHGLPSHSASSNFAPLSKDSLASHCWSREQERDFRELETHSSKLAQGDANREQPLQQSLRASFFYLHSFYSIRDLPKKIFKSLIHFCTQLFSSIANSLMFNVHSCFSTLLWTTRLGFFYAWLIQDQFA